MTIKYLSTTTSDIIASRVDSSIKAVKGARNSIQVTLVAMIMHMHKHGDHDTVCKQANRLVEGCGNAINSRALVEYMVEFGGLVVGKDAEGNEGFTGWSGREHIEQRFNPNEDENKLVAKGTKACMWWEFKLASPWKGFSLEDALTQVLTRQEAAIEKAGDDAELLALVDTSVSMGTVVQIQSLIERAQQNEAA